MKLALKAAAACCSLAIAINTGCTNTNNSQSDSTSTPLLDIVETGGSTIVPESAQETAYEQEAPTCTVTFSAQGASISGRGALASGGSVTITAAGIYEISGECADAVITVEAAKEDIVVLRLNGAKLSSTDGSVICCKRADKLVLSTVEGSENSLCDSTVYTVQEEDEPDAAVYSKCDLVLAGEGTLSVSGNYNTAIRSKDGLKICSGTVIVSSVDDGIKAKDYIVAADGDITVECGGDAFKATNSEDASLGYINICGGKFTITSTQDAFQAQTELIIESGEISAVTGGGSATVEYKNEEFSKGGGRFNFGGVAFDFDSLTDDNGENAASAKGLKAGGAITISGGDFVLDCADDTIHGGGDVLIESGSFTLSSGDDGIHAGENLTINDGNINIITSYEGCEGKSIDVNGGNITLYAFDDGFNAAGGDNGSILGFNSSGAEQYLSISGGCVTINADGDGLDSNGTMAMSGGTVIVFGPTQSGNGAIDYESSFAMSGGTLIALGSIGMAQAPSTLSQPCLSINSNVSAGSSIEVRDEDGNVILSVETPKACQSLIFSSDKLVSGSSYTVYAQDTALETVEVTDGVSGSGASMQGGFGNHGNNRWDRTENPDVAPENIDRENPPDGFGMGGRGEKPNMNTPPAEAA